MNSKQSKIIVLVIFLVTVLFWGAFSFFDKHNIKEVDTSLKFDKEEVKPVIEQRVIVKNVYVNEHDYSSYTSDATGSSYWYVQFSSSVVRGYNLIEIKTPYADIGAMLKQIRDINSIKVKEYTQIEYMKQVPFESYVAFHKNSGFKK